MRSKLRISFTVLALALCASCAGLTYKRTDTGQFEGSLDVRWIAPNQFIYVPNQEHPLRFTTSGRRVIEPREMYTDGGSIPRLFWGLPGYSPWGYAPAFIIHDWLFEAHQCSLPEYRDITFEESADILAEGIKTLMVTDLAPKDSTTLWAIYSAVKTPLAQSLWDDAEGCRPVVRDAEAAEAEPPGELLVTVRFAPAEPD